MIWRPLKSPLLGFFKRTLTLSGGGGGGDDFRPGKLAGVEKKILCCHFRKFTRERWGDVTIFFFNKWKYFSFANQVGASAGRLV